MVDMQCSERCVRKDVRVRVPLGALWQAGMQCSERCVRKGLGVPRLQSPEATADGGQGISPWALRIYTYDYFF